MKRNSIIAYCLLLSWASFATTIEGKIAGFANQPLYLLRLEGLSFSANTVEAVSDAQGHFSFDITLTSDEVVAVTNKNKDFFMQIMVSAKESDVRINGEVDNKGQVRYAVKEGSLGYQFQSIVQTRSLVFRQREALNYMVSLYPPNSRQDIWLREEWANTNKSLDSVQQVIKNINSDLVHYYFEIDTKMMSQRQPEATVAAMKPFFDIDFADSRLFKSGQLRPLIDQQIKLLAALGKTLGMTVQDDMTHKMIDHIVKGLSNGDERNTPSVLSYLINGFTNDNRADYTAYLSEKSLSLVSCSLNDKDLEMKLKQNGLLKVGSQMSDIDFTSVKAPIKKLSDIKAEHIVLLFWSSECAHCQEELPKFKRLYPLLKAKGIELIAISMDENKAHYEEAVRDLTWINVCDFKSINSPLVKDYYITSTPSVFMVNKDLKLEYKNQKNIADALAALFDIQQY